MTISSKTTEPRVLPDRIDLDGVKAFPVRAHRAAFRKLPVVRICIKAVEGLAIRNPNTGLVVGGWAGKLRSEVRRVLNQQVTEAVNRVKGDFEPLPVDWKERWTEDMIAAQRGILYGVFDYGAEHAGMIVNTRQKFMDEDIIGSFALNDYKKPVDEWLRRVASASTATNARRIERIHDKARRSWDKAKKRGKTPKDVAYTLFEEGLARNQHHANMIAITNTQWAFNAGARQEYINAGVEVLEWMTSRDDSVCPFCATMDGVMVKSSDPFWGEGSTFQVQDGDNLRSMNIPYAIEHPPLHPRCACVLLPVLESMRVRIDTVAESSDIMLGVGAIETAVQVREKLLSESKRIDALTQKAKKLNDRDFTKVKEMMNEREILTISGDNDERINDLKKRITGINTRINNRIISVHKIIKRHRKYIYSGDKSKFNAVLPRNFSVGRRKITNYGVDEFKKLVGVDSLNGQTVTVKSTRKSRAYYRNDALYIPANAESHTVIHELGHWLEEQSEDVHRKAISFLNRRTHGESPVPLRKYNRRYKRNEYTRPDKFKEPYVGKVYKAENGNVYATEVVSMGMESIWRNPAQFATEDADYFDFIFNLMRGL